MKRFVLGIHRFNLISKHQVNQQPCPQEEASSDTPGFASNNATDEVGCDNNCVTSKMGYGRSNQRMYLT